MSALETNIPAPPPSKFKPKSDGRPVPHREPCVITSAHGYLSLDVQGRVYYQPDLDTTVLRVFWSVKEAKRVAKYFARKTPNKVVRVWHLPPDHQEAIWQAIQGVWFLTARDAEGNLLFLHRGEAKDEYRLLATPNGAIGYRETAGLEAFVNAFWLENQRLLTPIHSHTIAPKA